MTASDGWGRRLMATPTLIRAHHPAHSRERWGERDLNPRVGDYESPALTS